MSKAVRIRACTMADIARLAHVSKPTVSRALRGSALVTEETRQRVLTVARENGYAVNRQAQKLRSVRTNTIAVVMDFGSFPRDQRISDPFMYELLAGVSGALARRGQDLLMVHSPLADADAYLNLIASRSVDAIVVLGQGRREPVIRAAAQKGAPLVVWGAVSRDAPYCGVGSDNLRGGWLAGHHLLANGRRKLLFIGAADHAEIKLRLDGLRQAVQEGGGLAQIRLAPLETFSYEASVEAARRALRDGDPPDGVFAQSDTSAFACIAAFRDAGLLAPHQYSIVGYNDIPTSEHFHPPLTTVRQDPLAAGEMLVDKLMRVLNGEAPASEMLETELTIRAS